MNVSALLHAKDVALPAVNLHIDRSAWCSEASRVGDPCAGGRGSGVMGKEKQLASSCSRANRSTCISARTLTKGGKPVGKQTVKPGQEEN